MNNELIEVLKTMISKQTECIDILVDKYNGLLNTVKNCSGTIDTKTADDPRITKLPQNCNDVSVLQEHINVLNRKLYWVSSSCIDRELDFYALRQWGTLEGRKTWYYMEWTQCGIPEFVYEQLGKYPSYTDIDTVNGKPPIYLTINPRGSWDWEQRWKEYEDMRETHRKEKEEHDNWYKNLTPYEQKEYDIEKKKRMQEFTESIINQRKGKTKKKK